MKLPPKFKKNPRILLFIIVAGVMLPLIAIMGYLEELENTKTHPSAILLIVMVFALMGIAKFRIKKRGYSGKRRGWNEQEKRQVRRRQNGKCAKCGDVPPRWEYHHKDGHRSNNSIWNCQGLCPNCHSVTTHDEP
ncbi:hypothetical protein C6990_03325 [Nitrosopumilus sp. b3]|uniref:HNH endonuclease n=1 Tax=Nitrosopumilus sp. b3 TaxID=2109909 RepID=UPI0015F4EECF|nr:HNH endonuclease signature motif containing protein [Nitrosopumilus sp. b3]KAF6247499.1 hypothetical protein C6990_03325 [Nitrosopumilus sp. b3]